jgi:DNA-binding LacI/PurR family transcriptional regulator
MPKYVDIMKDITENIQKGVYSRGMPLPAEEKLRDLYGASRTSIRNALAMLEEQNFIQKRRGSGNFVSATFGMLSDGEKTAKVLIDLHDEHSESSFFTATSNIATLRGINSVFSGEGKRLAMALYHPDAENFDDELGVLSPNEGFIDLGNTITPELSAYLHRNNKKTVSICSGLASGYQYPSNPKVINDITYGIKDALNYYQEKGFKKFGYVALGENGLQNLRTFEKVLAENGAEFDYDFVRIDPKSTRNCNIDAEFETRAESLSRLFLSQDGQPPEVIFNDGELIYPIINFLKKSSPGLEKKIVWCGINNTISSNGDHNDMTVIVDSIQLQYEEAGYIAANMLLKWIETDEIDKEEIQVYSKFVSNEK